MPTSKLAWAMWMQKDCHAFWALTIFTIVCASIIGLMAYYKCVNKEDHPMENQDGWQKKNKSTCGMKVATWANTKRPWKFRRFIGPGRDVTLPKKLKRMRWKIR